MSRAPSPWWLALLLLAGACDDLHLIALLGPLDSTSDTGFDAGEPATSDAGASDAGASDAGASDAGASDAGASDAGESDAGESDAGAGAGASDAGGGADCSNAQAVSPPDVFDFDLWSADLTDSLACAPGAMGVVATYRVNVPAQKTLLVTVSPFADDVVLYLRDSTCTGPVVECEDRAPHAGDEELSYINTGAASRLVQVGVKTWSRPIDDIVISFVVR